MNRKGKSIFRCDAQIPAVAWRHVLIECGNVARRFRLNEDERADLEAETRAVVRKAMADGYDPRKGKPYSYIQGVVHNHLAFWMRKETRRRNDCVSLAVEKARHAEKARRTACNGYQQDIDDTSYPVEDRWDFGTEVPERRPGEERPSDFSWTLDLLTIALVRQAVGRLKGTSRTVCTLYLKHGKLACVFAKMRARRWRKGLGTAHFYGEMWPEAKADFIREWRLLEKRFGLDC